MASALGPDWPVVVVPTGAPWRKAMLAVPPPRLGTEGDVETVKVVVLVKSFP